MRSLLFLLAIASCKSKPAAPSLQATIGGKPVVMKQAFVKGLPVDGVYSVYVTSGKSSCDELLGGLYFDRGEHVLFTAGKRLARDGTLTSELVEVFDMGATVTIAPGSKVIVTGKLDPKAKVQLAIDAELDVEGKGHTSLHGTISAEACGVVAPFETPKVKHPSTATLTVAGHVLPIASARRRDYAFELSTGPLACTDATPIAAMILSRESQHWELEGQWLAAKLRNDSAADKDGQPETKALRVEEGATGTSVDGPTVQLALSGSGTIGGYPVSLAGAIEMLDCRTVVK